MNEIEKETFRNTIVIVASTGGLSAIDQLLSKLPATRDTAVLCLAVIVPTTKKLIKY